MKLGGCSPGFVDNRDAVLDADVALYAGANQCLLWRAFAKRGLGESALQRSAMSTTDGTEAFHGGAFTTFLLQQLWRAPANATYEDVFEGRSRC